MLLRLDLAGSSPSPWQGREGAVVAHGVVHPLLVDLEEAVEADDRAGGPDAVRFAVLARDVDVGGGAFDLGARCLARQRSLPDQLVEFGGVRIEVAGDLLGILGEVGRSDGFMRLLRVFGLGLVFARGGRHIVVAIKLGDETADGRDRFGHDLHAVGPHIGDQALASPPRSTPS
jgi:hypothetical protein